MLVRRFKPMTLSSILHPLCHRAHSKNICFPGVRELSHLVNKELMKLVRSCQKNRPQESDSDLDLKAILDVLVRQLQRGRVDTKLAALKWIYHLYTIAQENVSLSRSSRKVEPKTSSLLTNNVPESGTLTARAHFYCLMTSMKP